MDSRGRLSPHKSQLFYRNLVIRIDAHFAGDLHRLFRDLPRQQLGVLQQRLRCRLGLRPAAADGRNPAVRLYHISLTTKQEGLLFIRNQQKRF